MIDASNVAIVLLAAGGSRRFGSNDKLLGKIDGEPMAVCTARTLAALAPARLIGVCKRKGELARALEAIGFDIVLNPAEDLGLSRSLTLGIQAAARTEQAAALVCLADMPFVSVGHLHTLLTRFDASTAPIVASTNGEAAMPPALFARSLFGRLEASSGDRGARPLLNDALLIPAAPEELRDIDRPSDLP